MSIEVKQWATRANGARGAFFEFDDEIRVDVQAMHAEENERVLTVAQTLAATTEALRAADLQVCAAKAEARQALERAASAETALAEMRATLPPKSPARLLGRGHVRFDSDGTLWLMNKLESGWSSFGLRFSSWDEVFRRFNVRVVGHGEDEDGPWWAVENCDAGNGERVRGVER